MSPQLPRGMLTHDVPAALTRVPLLMHAVNTYAENLVMPRAAVENDRVDLRVRPADKAMIVRAAALAQTDMTTFILRAVLREAELVIGEHERIESLSP